MKRALTLGLMLIATAVNAADLALSTKHTELRALSPSRESLGQKTQWAPSGNFSALHGRAVFRGETESGTRPYARARGEVASDIGIFLSRDSIGAHGRLGTPNALGPWSYANLSPARYTDPDGRDGVDIRARQRSEMVVGACRGGDDRRCDAAIASDYRFYKAVILGAQEGIHSAFEWRQSRAAENTASTTAFLNRNVGGGAASVFNIAAGAADTYAASVAELAVQFPVSVVGIGLLPETLYRSKAEFEAGQLQYLEGGADGDTDKKWLGVGRMSGVVGLYFGVGAGVAKLGPTRGALGTPVSELIADALVPDLGDIVVKDALLGREAPRSLTTKPMENAFQGENLQGNTVWPGGRQTMYFSKAARQRYQLTIKDGRLLDASGKPFDTSLLPGRRALFVLDEEGSLYAYPGEALPGRLHHSSLVAGENVAMAGEIEVTGGALKAFSDKSGHYIPQKWMADQFSEFLSNHGVDPSGLFDPWAP